MNQEGKNRQGGIPGSRWSLVYYSRLETGYLWKLWTLISVSAVGCLSVNRVILHQSFICFTSVILMSKIFCPSYKKIVLIEKIVSILIIFYQVHPKVDWMTVTIMFMWPFLITKKKFVIFDLQNFCLTLIRTHNFFSWLTEDLRSFLTPR